MDEQIVLVLSLKEAEAIEKSCFEFYCGDEGEEADLAEIASNVSGTITQALEIAKHPGY